MQRQLDIGGVIGRVWRIYVDQASVLMPAAAVVFVVTGVIAALVASGGSLVGWLIAEVILIVAGMLFTGMIVQLVADVQDGHRDATAGQLLSAATPVLGQLIFVGFVAGIAIVAGFFLLVVPGLVLITIWSVFVPVIVLEHPPGLGALGRSRDLVRGNGWQVFAVLLVLFVLVGGLASVIDGVASSAGTGVGLAVRVVMGVLTAPFASLASAVLYFDLRRVAGESSGGVASGLAGLT